MMADTHTHRWRQASIRYRRRFPLCAICLKKGTYALGAVVDHILPRDKRPELMWEESNWQTLCLHCHNSTKQSIERNGYDKQSIDDTGWPTDPQHPVNKRKF